MALSCDNIIHFQKIYKEKFGKEISKEDAQTQGIKLLTLVKSIYKPITREQHNIVQNHRRNTINQINYYDPHKNNHTEEENSAHETEI